MKYGKIEIGESSFEEKFYGKTPPAPPTEPVVPVEEPVPPYMPPYYLTAYGIAVKNGFVGTETDWLESLKGDTGAQGAPGVGIYSVEKISGSGDPGETDTYGVYLADDDHTLLGTFDVYNGETGPEGPEGQQGPAGADGAAGINGQDGENGVSITAVTLTSGTHAPGTLDTYTVHFSDGNVSTFQVYNGDDGAAGANGVGIADIQFTSGDHSPGSTDTYTVLMEDGNSYTITVYNGADGNDGVGIASIDLTSGTHAPGTLDTYTILYDNNDTTTFQVYNGDDGADGTDGNDGNGIASITLTSGDHSPGTSDVYTITFTDGTSSTFSVYNGTNGTSFKLEVVQTLPITGDTGTIYLVPNGGTTPNIYDEYIYNNGWEKIGTTEFTQEQANWTEIDSTKAGYIKNKPSLATTTAMLKGDNAGGTTAAVAGTDFQAPLPTQTGKASTVLSTTGSALEWRSPFVPYAQVDDTSTSTVFTATVPGITELKNGVWMLLKNGVVTSAAGFTINVNNLGAKPSYSNMAAATADTTLFNINYTMLFIYDETRIEGGCWVCYRGYNSNDNTIGYQLRTNTQKMPVSGATYRYRLLFTSADGTKYVPANTSTSTNATASRTVNQTPINPFGAIYYYSNTSAVSSGSSPGATYLWQQYNFTLGYSFNRTGAALTLTSWKPVYVVAAPQTDGSAIMDSTTPYVQALPTTDDGKIYIFLGIATSATQVEMTYGHPVYYYKDGMIRLWTNPAASGSGTIATTSNMLKGDNAGNAVAATAGTDYQAPLTGGIDYDLPPVVAAISGNSLDGYTSDKTFVELYSAVLDGIAIYAAYVTPGAAQLICPATILRWDTIIFTAVTYENPYYCLWTITITSTDTVSVVQTDLQEHISVTDGSMLKFSSNAVTAATAGTDYFAPTGGEVTGDITLKAPAASNSYCLIFQRGTLSDNYNDWMIQDRGGYLYFDERGNGSSAWTNRVMFDTTGKVTASSFAGSGANLTGVVQTVNGNSGTITVREVPAVSSSDNGKVLRVVNGAWAAVDLPSASGVSF